MQDRYNLYSIWYDNTVKNHSKSWKICEWCNFGYPFNLNISNDIAIQNAIKLNFSEIVGRGAYASIEPVLIKLNEG